MGFRVWVLGANATTSLHGRQFCKAAICHQASATKACRIWRSRHMTRAAIMTESSQIPLYINAPKRRKAGKISSSDARHPTNSLDLIICSTFGEYDVILLHMLLQPNHQRLGLQQLALDIEPFWRRQRRAFDFPACTRCSHKVHKERNTPPEKVRTFTAMGCGQGLFDVQCWLRIPDVLLQFPCGTKWWVLGFGVWGTY